MPNRSEPGRMESREPKLLGMVLLAQFLLYSAGNAYSTGPTFLSDEISYLSKAATLAGYPVDLSNDWHAGYSLLLVPAFWLGREPDLVWKLILGTNALLWSGSFALLYGLLKRLLPESSTRERLWAVGLTCLYPGFLISSGYALATSAIVFLYLLSVTLRPLQGSRAALGHGLAVGFLYWVHPTGLAFAAASVLALAWSATRARTLLPWLLSTSATVGMAALYKFSFHPWLNQAMALGSTDQSQGTAQPGPYEATSSLFQRLLSGEFWLHWPVMAGGTVSYLLVASLGVILPAFLTLLKLWRQEHRNDVLYLALTPLALTMLSAVFLGISSVGWPVQGPHSWYLGRYAEAALAPLLGLGLLTTWPRRAWLGAFIWVGVSALAIALVSTPENTSPSTLPINILGFWPYSLAPRSGFLIPFALGGAGIVLVGWMGPTRGRVVITLVFLLNLYPMAVQHTRGLFFQSTPTAIKTVVRELYPPGTRLHFDPWLPENAVQYQRERRNLYTFHLFDYPTQRCPEGEWGDAPLLTFRPRAAQSSGMILVARERQSGLCLLLPPGRGKDLIGLLGEFPRARVSLEWSESELAGCFHRQGAQLENHWTLGRWNGKVLSTVGRRGTLFTGPFFPLAQGPYQLHLEGEFQELEGATLLILSSDRRLTFLEVPVSSLLQAETGALTTKFELPQPVQDLEIRMTVSQDTDLGIESYRVEPDEGVH